MRDGRYYVYMMANKRNGTFYVGVTGDLQGRVWEHKEKIYKGFTARYNVDKLVWYDAYPDPGLVIAREKQLKKYYRWQKIELVEQNNLAWQDLYETLGWL